MILSNYLYFMAGSFYTYALVGLITIRAKDASGQWIALVLVSILVGSITLGAAMFRDQLEKEAK